MSMHNYAQANLKTGRPLAHYPCAFPAYLPAKPHGDCGLSLLPYGFLIQPLSSTSQFSKLTSAISPQPPRIAHAHDE
jgi:hypothetical protein